MPYLDATAPVDPAAQQWHSFFHAAFRKCVQASNLEIALSELVRRNRLPPAEIANILMGFRARDRGFDVSLLFQYAKLLLRTKCIGTADVLLAMLRRSKFTRPAARIRTDACRAGLPTSEERMFTLITQLYLRGEIIVNPRDAHRLIYAIVRWMRTVVEYETTKQLETTGLHSPDVLTSGMYEALGSLALTVLSQRGIRIITKLKWWKARRSQIVGEMENFDMNILQWTQSQLAGRLRALSKMPPFVETDIGGRPIFTEQQILESVVDLPVVRSRAGLYIWLNACLCGRPLTDDMSLIGYLQARYPGDSQSLAVDFLIAAFDTLTNALLRKEPRQTVKEIRSFICNKIPIVLAMISGYITPLSAEACIQMAFMAITMDILPPISAGSTDVREMLKRTRFEFLQACSMHGLVTEAAITGITQEPLPNMPRVAKQSRENLVAQCNSNAGRLETLVDDLQSMNGNVGAVASCVVDVINNLCITKDTMSLKSFCNILMTRIPDVDIILQYTQPTNLMLPLASLLNEWVHDQDQTEFTPSYEEFSCILLFVLTVAHRYDLTVLDIGIVDEDSFVSMLLRNLSDSTMPSELTEEQSGQLASWVEGLFSTDDHGDIGGIGDDVMRQCPPHAFYLLVPTLFEQSVLACKTNSLSLKTLKGGLELLLEPFLLPSLIGGLSWLIKHSWEDHGDADVLLQVLDKLLKPSSTSQETQAMHRAVLGIVATPLTQSLEELVRKRPEKKFAHALIELLKPYIGRQRTHYRPKSESDQWASHGTYGLAASLRTVIREMISWTSSVGPNPPTKYTHAMFTTACQILGPGEVLSVIVDEIKQQTAVGNGPTALDICTALICSPTPQAGASALNLGSATSRDTNSLLNVHDALRLTIANTNGLLSKPISETEALLRLSRRVESQSALPQLTQVPIPMQTQTHATDEIMKDLGFTDADVAGTSTSDGVPLQIDVSSTDNFATTGLDLTNTTSQDLSNLTSDDNAMRLDQNHNFYGRVGMDMNAASGSMGALETGNMMGDGQQSKEEDIFADLDMGLGDFEDFSFA
ncbi:mediator of rna polymerase ii transcription subunit 5 [Acrodontium crateriforme]|uniref:Mediator of RNA polymerase II transcription subunit 5 n=1 Tax=Acrodontium crateriforme TaxID=150365 RepID=A0AAQ3M474_9PEZI|nr:mediator of rna polymerase ii transcription subunit 5 [Acrodontium crateriforme]